jgi:hypothetical protein
MAEDTSSCPSEDEVPQARVPVRTHYKQINFTIANIFLEYVGNCFTVGLHIFSNGIHVMSHQLGCEPCLSLRFGGLAVNDAENSHLLRLLKNRQGIDDCPR